MKILVISDTHLTGKFDNMKFHFLQTIFQSADQVIINGDFWDSWFTSFDNFLNSPWKSLFPLLLDKKTIYIYGNHDPFNKCDSRVNLFSVWAGEGYDLSVNETKYHIEHGDKILKGKRSVFLEIYGLLLDYISGTCIESAVHKVLHALEYIGYQLLGVNFMTSSKPAIRNNEILKSSNKSGNFLICGDTHCAELSGSSLYANSGCINYGNASFLLISSDNIILQKERY